MTRQSTLPAVLAAFPPHALVNEKMVSCAASSKAEIRVAEMCRGSATVPRQRSSALCNVVVLPVSLRSRLPGRGRVISAASDRRAMEFLPWLPRSPVS